MDNTPLSITQIYIQRDYQEGTICKFKNKFPPELEGKIDKQYFEDTINTLNEMYREAEKFGPRTFIEGCLGCMTAYLSYIFIDTTCEKYLKKIRKYIHEQNESIYIPKGLYLTDPLEKGLRVLEISIYEPTSQHLSA
ncbi:unnamed protein product [Gordionus sp. m RMFG-2023]|uniref:golgin subfamily A member 7-like n=1 Tax=Gordionus sp. m RMFG-2023 TaxID=3053472 RepID=UPI0030E099C1